jgi:uncharacterized protein (DUF2062 family)
MAALVPVYNHVGTVGEVVRALRGLGATVLAVDDGSTDGSGDAAEAAGAEVLRLPTNHGKGAALSAGFALAASRGFTQALTCDADGQHPPEAAAILARSASETTAVHVGRRRMESAPRPSRIGRWWSNLWTWLCCGWWVGDSQSGLRVYPLPATTLLPVRAGRYAFEIEVLVRAAWAGLVIRHISVPVIYPRTRISHFRMIADNARASAAFFRLVWRRLLPWPHRRLAPRRRTSLRQALSANLEPWQVASACALGAAMGVAPLPGLQMAATAWLAWLLRLNIALALVVSNHSIGPLLALWYALAAALGLYILSGQQPMESFTALRSQLHDAAGMSGTLSVLEHCLSAWLLGSLLLMCLLGLLGGFFGYLCAILARGRAVMPPPPVSPEAERPPL